jgi:serine-type D-Ala-D-Ala carboxypeptidase (penicillin-binding protein 5/6)
MVKLLKRLILPALTILAAFLVYLYLRPLPALKPVSQIVNVPKPQSVQLPWPPSGQSAIGASGYGLLESHNAGSPVPIGSVAKVITALAVLKQKPMAANSQGPILTLSSSDVNLFNTYYLKDGSVAQVAAGEQISEMQALQALLLPSANNIADSLAIWAFGSLNSYITYANGMVKNMGLKTTVVGDTNGFSDTTTSTAADLVKLGIVAMANPVIAQVVSQGTAQIPVEGTISNLNQLLGTDGVNGIKTGNTDKAGSCYLFSAQRVILGHQISLIGAVLGQTSLVSVFQAVPPLIKAADSGFNQVTVLHKGQTSGYYQAPWGPASDFKSTQDLSLFAWKDQAIVISNKSKDIKVPLSSGSQIGTVTVNDGGLSAAAPLELSRNLAGPSWHWRIFRK